MAAPLLLATYFPLQAQQSTATAAKVIDQEAEGEAGVGEARRRDQEFGTAGTGAPREGTVSQILFLGK